MNADPEFAAEVKLQQTIFEAVTEKDVLDFRDTLDEIQREKDGIETSNNARVIRMLPRRILAIAATILILVIGGIFVLRKLFGPPNPEELYASYFEIPIVEDIMDPAVFRSRIEEQEPGTIDSIEQNMLSIRDLFNSGQYANALNKLESTRTPRREKNSNFHFMAGILYLINERPQDALNSFERVTGIYQEDKKWYEAMAFLKLPTIKRGPKQIGRISRERQSLAKKSNPTIT